MGILGPFPAARARNPRSALFGLQCRRLCGLLIAAIPFVLLFAAAEGRAKAVSADLASEAIRDAPLALSELARHPIWLALTHQARRSLAGDSRRALNEARFFFHPEGARRPDLELDATLTAFELPDTQLALANRCRFPARHLFLAEQGLVSPERGVCKELDAWRKTIGDFQLTLIFPEAFLGNPASMFGHTLLRLDPIATRTDGKADSLLSWALDYSASAEGDVGAIYMIRGLIGGYRGKFSLARYYERIKVYSDWQDRDIWEYPLDMAREDRERMLLHVWELREVTLPYYFFTQNCSEKILELLEVGWSRLERAGGFPPAITPVDTLRAMAALGDIVGKPVLRPSPATRLQNAMSRLSSDGADRVEALAEGRLAVDNPTLADLDDPSRGKLFELAYDLLRHRYLSGKATEADSRGRSRALLLARSRIKTEVEADPAPLSTRDRIPPDRGHGTARVELAGGVQDRDGFIELHLQPAYHTRIDAPGGFAEGGEIKALDTTIRVFPKNGRIRLHEFVLLDVSTASPWRRPFRPLGWRFDLGLRTRLFSRRNDNGLEPEPVFRVQGGVGAAVAPLPGLHLYGFGELALEAASKIEGNSVAGPVARFGLAYSTPKGRFTFHAEAIAGVLAGRRTSPWLELRLEQRVGLTEKWSIRFGGRYEHAYDVGHFEGRMGLLRYF